MEHKTTYFEKCLQFIKWKLCWPSVISKNLLLCSTGDKKSYRFWSRRQNFYLWLNHLSKPSIKIFVWARHLGLACMLKCFGKVEVRPPCVPSASKNSLWRFCLEFWLEQHKMRSRDFQALKMKIYCPLSHIAINACISGLPLLNRPSPWWPMKKIITYVGHRMRTNVHKHFCGLHLGQAAASRAHLSRICSKS